MRSAFFPPLSQHETQFLVATHTQCVENPLERTTRHSLFITLFFNVSVTACPAGPMPWKRRAGRSLRNLALLAAEWRGRTWIIPSPTTCTLVGRYMPLPVLALTYSSFPAPLLHTNHPAALLLPGEVPSRRLLLFIRTCTCRKRELPRFATPLC